MWHNHHNSLLFSSRDTSKKESVDERVAAVDYVDRYNVSDISRVISKLKKNKYPGADMLCSEHFIYICSSSRCVKKMGRLHTQTYCAGIWFKQYVIHFKS